MVALVASAVVFLFTSFSFASYIPHCSTNQPLKVPSIDARAASTVSTPLGTASGSATISGVIKFAVRYATSKRWSPSVVANVWQPPNGSANFSADPLPCPQPGMPDSSFSEDCLSMILYVPVSLNLSNKMPTMVWIHGGSFIVGSATNPGLDGSNLAVATNSIVAVVQYRLGALGFMVPNGGTNLAVHDIVNALTFLKKIVPSFGGSSSKITIAGQSSGASMVRALLAVPSASSMFQSGIIQSDPMDYGFLSTTTQQKMQSYFNTQIGCSSSDTQCQNNLPVDSIINAQMNLFGNAINIDPSAGQGEPIRPVKDGSFITSPLDSTAPFPGESKPLLISTVRNESALTIFETFTDPLPMASFGPMVNMTFGSPRTQTILSSSFYSVNPSASGDARINLEVLGTDYLWRCSSWTFARNWVQSGGKAFVGMYVVGATYPGNEQASACTQPGVICHQDDIEIVFGTVPNPTSAQSALTTQMQKYYASFLSTGNPNGAGQPQWNPATTTNVHALVLGGSGEVAAGPCDPSFWGSAVQYDYQVYGI